MNYIGSKKRLLGFIEKAVSLCEVKKDNPVFCDLFAGTGIVGRHFKGKGFKIIANDMERYSHALISHYIKNSVPMNIKPWLNKLNSLQGVDTGFIFNHYCPSGQNSKVMKMKDGQEVEMHRQYFSDENGKIIDEARQIIEVWFDNNKISREEYSYLLAVIIEAADKVANTTSVYGAFLKKFKKSALNKIVFEELDYVKDEKKHEVFNMNADTLIDLVEGDILYLDPPYNERQYGANYHVLNTIAEGSEPDIRGITGLRDYEPSRWCRKKEVANVLEDMIRKANFDYILMSYNSEGLLTPKQIEDIMSKYGDYVGLIQDYGRFKADKEGENRNYASNRVFEYIHILRKRK